MSPTTLPKLGIIVPDIGQDPWGDEMNANLTKIDGLAGSLTEDLEEDLALYLDPATVSSEQPNTIIDGVAVTVLPPNVLTRLLGKWKPKVSVDFTQAIKVVLRYSFGAGSGADATIRIIGIPIQVNQAPGAATPITLDQVCGAVAQNVQAEAAPQFVFNANTGMVAFKIERNADNFTGTINLWSATVRWQGKKA